jgi:prepilin-type N-terminal cleavage/methylation domain-containing protein
MKRAKNKTAFSLMEMMIVIAIIAVLSGMLLGVATYIDTQSKQRSLKSTFAVLHGALQEYYNHWQAFPDPNKPNTPPFPSRSAALYAQLNATPATREILSQLSNKSLRTVAPDTLEFVDPWGTVLDYLYIPGDTFPTLVSAGPDKNPLTPGDNISNK